LKNRYFYISICLLMFGVSFFVLRFCAIDAKLCSDLLFKKAMRHYGNNDYHKALRYFEKNMLVNPAHDETYLYAAVICEEIDGKEELAKKYYQQYMQLTQYPEKKALVAGWLNNLTYPDNYSDKTRSTVETNHAQKLESLIKENRRLSLDNQKLISQIKEKEPFSDELESLKTKYDELLFKEQQYLARIDQLNKDIIAKNESLDKNEQELNRLKLNAFKHINLNYRKTASEDINFINDYNFEIKQDIKSSCERILPDNKEDILRYSIRKGDTLLSIARKFYGDDKYWKLIWETNKYQLSNKDNLQAGQILLIPKIQAKEP